MYFCHSLVNNNYKKDMSKFRYKIQDYHAIKEANININGITVLAGENGCGKSTLSRWLYYVINVIAKFELIVYQDYINFILNTIKQWDFVGKDISRTSLSKTNSNNSQFAFIKMAEEQLERLLHVNEFNSDNIEKAKIIFFKTFDIFLEQLKTFLDSEVLSFRKNRVLNYLNIKKTITNDNNIVINNYKKSEEYHINLITNKIYTQIEKRTKDNLYRLIYTEYFEIDSHPKNLQLIEDDVELFDENHISYIYNLTNAIYVDTPMSITSEDNKNELWKKLKALIYEDSNNGISIDTKKIIKRVSNIIGGEIKLENNLFSDELRYISSDKSIDITLDKAATGIKTFSYIQRLLQNGYLTNKTLLLIDEPEAHLHPQWIVDYARLLVHINKYLGTKIMIASHNPDMVAAIRSIAEKEDILEETHFYIAQKEKNSAQYSYKDLGHNIEEIFKSFNIALERINLYGANNIQ